MALSASYNYTVTRDNLISRALRIIGAIGQGETPQTTAVTEAALALNDIMKEWQADGMQLWKRSTLSLSGATTGTTVTIGASGANITNVAPLKIVEAYYKNTSSGNDHPLQIVTKQEYDRLTPKATTGTPTQLYYSPPGAKDSAVASGNYTGTVYLYPAPSTTFLAANTIYVTGVFPLMDFDASTDQPDIPDFMINALVWTLADQLAYEYGLGPVEKSQINKKAMQHKAMALAFDQEEGSLRFVPNLDGTVY